MKKETRKKLIAAMEYARYGNLTESQALAILAVIEPMSKEFLERNEAANKTLFPNTYAVTQ